MTILKRAQVAQQHSLMPAVFLTPKNSEIAERDAKIADLTSQLKAIQDRALRLDRLDQVTIHETDNVKAFQARFNGGSKTRVFIQHTQVTVVTK